MSFFITFEGVEGCGKTTQARMLADYLRAKGFSVFTTREPGGTSIGNSIRKILLAPGNKDMNFYTELYLYVAARVQHVEEVIIPHLQQESIVICDRFSDATKAYQGYGRGMPLALIKKLHAAKPLSLKPDITFLLDVDHTIALRRARKRNSAKQSLLREGRVESESLSFHSRIREGYLKIARTEKKRVKVVDASKSIKSVHTNITRIMDQFLKSS